MSLKPYSEYKDTGIQWLGNIPKQWKLTPLKFHFKIVGGSTPKSDNKDYWDGDIKWVTPSDLSKLDSFYIHDSQRKITLDGLNSCGSSLVPKGSVVLSTRAPIGTIGIAFTEVCTNQGCKSLVPDNQTNPIFFTYLLSISSVELNLRGKGTTFLELSGDELGSFKVGFPTPREQSIIANFLDRETAKLDTLIAKQEKLIELLQEKRQAIISHAVTKGLDPNVKMKDSGVEWLGMVPEHWICAAIKHIVSIPITDGPHETPNFYDFGVPFVSAEAVSGGQIDFSKIRGYISKEDHEKYSKKYRPSLGDVYMIKSGATTGVTAIVETDIEFNIWSPLAVIRCGSKMLPRFTLYFMRSLNFQEAVSLNWSFGTQQNIGMNVIENLSITIPPLKEQLNIIKYLDELTSNIDLIIKKSKKSIELAKEHRTALISAAVTGKIDVREYA